MISRIRGDTHPITYTVSRKSTNLIQDVGGSVFIMSATDDASATYIFQVTADIINAARGEISFTLAASEVDNIGAFSYDIQMESAGYIRTVESGTLIFQQDITK